MMVSSPFFPGATVHDVVQMILNGREHQAALFAAAVSDNEMGDQCLRIAGFCNENINGFLCALKPTDEERARPH